MNIQPKDTIGNIKKAFDRWLLDQGLGYTIKTFRFNDGVKLDPVVFTDDRFFKTSLEGYQGKLDGGEIHIETYIRSGSKDQENQSGDVLDVGAKSGCVDVVKYIITRPGFDVNGPDGEIAAAWAVQKGHLDVLKQFVEKGYDIRATNDYLLRLAARNGHLDLVKYLVENGADPKARGDEAYKTAVRKGFVDIANYLK